MQKRTHILALTLTALAPILWSTGGVGLRLLDVPPWTILFWRGLFMTLTVVAWSALTMRLRFLSEFRRSSVDGFWVFVFIAMSFIFYVLSMTATTVADSLLIQGTAPIFIVVLGWIVLREPLRGITIIALFAIIVGILIIMIPSFKRGGFTGNLLGLAKAIAFAAGTIAIRRKKSVGLVPSMALAAGLTTIIAAPMVPSFRIDPLSLLILGYLGTVQVGLSFILFVSWSGKIAASETGLLVILEAVLGPLWVWIFLGEQPFTMTLLGGAVIIAALVTHTLVYTREGLPSTNLAKIEAAKIADSSISNL